MNNEFPRNMNELEEIIGYTFTDREVFREALTHSSYANELRARGVKSTCNERLEFLGDSVLSICVSEYLFEKYSHFPEGELTKIRASVVCEKALFKYAQIIKLGEFLLLGHGENTNNGRGRPSICADAFEALLAAIYEDSGCRLEPIRAFLMPYVISEIEYIQKEESFVDYKTALQQVVQAVDGELLEYVLVNESGPDHKKIFSVEARLNSNVIGHGTAGSKREAEQMAAKEALTLFGINERI